MRKSGTFWRQRRWRGLMRNDGWWHRHTDHRRQVWLSKRRMQDRHSYSKCRGQQVRGKAICPEGPEWHGGMNANKKQKSQQGHRGAIRKPGLEALLSCLHNESRTHQFRQCFPSRALLPIPRVLGCPQWVDEEGRVGGKQTPRKDSLEIF